MNGTRWWPRLALLAGLAVGIAGMANLAPAADVDLLTFVADRIPLRKAVQAIIHNRDVDLVTGEELAEEVTVNFSEVPWRVALESLLRAHGYTTLEERGIVRVLRLPRGEEDSPRRQPLVLRLKYIPVAEALRALRPLLNPQGRIVELPAGPDGGGAISVIDAPETLELIQQLLPEIDVPPRPAIAELRRIDDDRIDLRLREFPLARLGELLQENLGINVYSQVPLSGYETVSLQDVSWRDALRRILSRHGLGFREEDGVLRIDEKKTLTSELVTREFSLRFVDGWDLKPYLEKLLGPDGRIACFSASPRAGFEFGSKVSERRSANASAPSKRRARLISVRDRESTVRLIAEQIERLDRLPQQIEVDVKIVQITRDSGRDLGIDWETALSLSGSLQPTTIPFGQPGGTLFPGPFPDPTGANFSYGVLDASRLSAILRLLEETGEGEVLSQPNITTLDSVEASILIGQKFPVTTETIDPQTAVRTVTLDYYEDIGIQLLVVPSVTDGDRVHLVIHPAVSAIAELIEDRFPVIQTREADTQVVLRTGETVVIGGLLEHREETRIKRVPGLGHIPLFGRLFTYEDTSDDRTELVIMVTPRIVQEPSELVDSLLLEEGEHRRIRELDALFRKAFQR